MAGFTGGDLTAVLHTNFFLTCCRFLVHPAVLSWGNTPRHLLALPLGPRHTAELSEVLSVSGYHARTQLPMVEILPRSSVQLLRRYEGTS